MPSSAELTETGDGWALRLTLDEELRASVLHELASGAPAVELQASDLSMSVCPNLVPGDPFPIAALTIVLTTGEPGRR